MSVENTAKDLVEALKGGKTTSAYDTPATVTRIDDSILWVHIPGGVEETPIKRTIGASVGDEVQVRVSNGQAWVVGNASAPPTDDTRANYAVNLAAKAEENAIVAQNAATSAQISANTAASAAATADAKAVQAATAASNAQTAAETADAKAVQAATAASNAQTAAETADAKAVQAATAASNAQTSANNAANAAATADSKAVQAANAAATADAKAVQAATAASNAQTSADNASQAAHSALTQLSTVEDVVGTLNWISEHGTYVATTDTEVVAGKLYFTRTGSGTEQDPYVYTVVTNPTGNPSTSGYFELDSIDGAVSNYVASHLALTDEGLYVINDQNGWRVLIKNDGVYIVNDSGTVVAQYKDVVTIGELTQSYTRISNSSFQLVDRGDNIFFNVSDFRDSNGEYGRTEQFTGDGVSTTFYTKFDINRVLSVKVDGVVVSDYTLNRTNTAIVFTTAPIDQTSIVISYKTTSNLIKALIFGDRDAYRYFLSKDNEVIPGKFYYNHVIDEIVTDEGSYTYEHWDLIKNPSGSPGLQWYYERSGFDSSLFGILSVSEGRDTYASGDYSHAEGNGSHANGVSSHAEGVAIATGDYSHAESGGSTINYIGLDRRITEASGLSSHAEGDGTIASGKASHAEGLLTVALGDYSHAEGRGFQWYTAGTNRHETTASGIGSHAEGGGTVASGDYSHAEGSSFFGISNVYTEASGNYSHVEGLGTVAEGESQHVFGKFNISDSNNTYVEIVGNGEFIDDGTSAGSHAERSNARTLDWNGNEWLAGGLDANAPIVVHDANIDATATHTSNYWGTGRQYNFVDKNGVDIGHIRPFVTSSDQQGMYFEVSRDIHGTTMINYLRLAIDGSGNQVVLLPAAAWRSALGVSQNYSKTVTGTTDANGFITLSLANGSYIPLVARSSHSDDHVEFTTGSTSWWGRVTNKGVARANTSVTIDVYYTDKP